MTNHNDKHILVIYNPQTAQIRTEVFSFHNLRGAARATVASSYDRYLEALRGQGCKVAAIHIEDWWRFAGAYPDHFLNRWREPTST